MDFITDIEEQKRQKQLDDQKEQKFKQKIEATKAVEKAVKDTGKSVSDAVKANSTIKVSNLPKDYSKSADVRAVVAALEALGRVIAANDDITRQELSESLSKLDKPVLNVDNAEIVEAIKNLQKSVTKKENVTVKNLDDLADFFFSLEQAVREMNLSPVIDVKAPDVKVDVPEVDLSLVAEAIKGIQPTLIEDEDAKAETLDKLDTINKTLNKILARPIPVGSGGGGGASGGGTQPSSSSVTSVADSASNQTLKAANGDRIELLIQNDSDEILYVKFGATASSTDYTYRLYDGDALRTSYTGRVDGIWAANSTGAAKITELTA